MLHFKLLKKRDYELLQSKVLTKNFLAKQKSLKFLFLVLIELSNIISYSCCSTASVCSAASVCEITYLLHKWFLFITQKSMIIVFSERIQKILAKHEKR